MSNRLKSLRASVACAACAGLLLVSAGSASAATFAPAGDSFQASSGQFTFVIGGNRYVTCSSSNFTGMVANPASPLASISAPAIGPPPCSSSPTAGYWTAEVATAGAWKLQAVSPTRVNLVVPSASNNVIRFYAPTYGYVCSAVLSGGSMGAANDWSNTNSTLTLSAASGPSVWITGGFPCPLSLGQTYSTTVSATYAVSNTSNPGTPVTVQP